MIMGLANALVKLRAIHLEHTQPNDCARARLLQRSLASVGIEPLIVIVRSGNQVLDAVRESNPVEAPAPVELVGVEPTAPAFLWRTAPRQ
jgi:hypothetical protein